MEFKEDLKGEIENAKIVANSIEGLSEKEREIVFGKMVDKILNSNRIQEEKVTFLQNTSSNEEIIHKDIQELYHELNPKTGLDNVLLIAYYNYTKERSFAVKDLLESYKILLLPAPSNPSDLINKNRSKGLIMLSGKDEKKNNLFSITRKGLSYVKKGFKEIKNE